MGDVGDDYRALRELNAERRQRNLENASKDGWYLHTEYHWSRTLNGKVMCGDVLAFIKKHGV